MRKIFWEIQPAHHLAYLLVFTRFTPNGWFFLEYFGLRGLDELPNAEELQQIPITKPEAPVTTGEDTSEDEQEQMSLEEVSAGTDEEFGDDEGADEPTPEEVRLSS